MYFRKSFLARNFFLPPDPPPDVEFVIAAGHTITVRITNIPRDEKPFGVWEPSARCTGVLQTEVPRKTFKLFEALNNGNIPDLLKPEDFWRHGRVDQDPVFAPGRVPSFLGPSLDPVEHELETAVNTVVGLLRWRCNVTGPVDVPPLNPLEWSIDNSDWRLDVRRPPLPTASYGPDVVVTESRRRDVEAMIRAGTREPLHQSLLREAEGLTNSNPRSALTIGVAAAETAVKFLVGHFAPDAAWLIKNLQSPPIVKMLDQYVPMILDHTVKFSPDFLEKLRQVVAWRNELVHGAREIVKESELDSALSHIRDVVWLCDHLMGQKWAINRVRKETLTAMGLSPQVDNTHWFVD